MRSCSLLLVLLFLSLPAKAGELSDLHEAIKEVCPVVGVSGDMSKLSAIRIDFAPEATPEQKALALEVKNTFDPESDGKKDVDKKIEALLLDAAEDVGVTDEVFQQLLTLKDRAKMARKLSTKKGLLAKLRVILKK